MGGLDRHLARDRVAGGVLHRDDGGIGSLGGGGDSERLRHAVGELHARLGEFRAAVRERHLDRVAVLVDRRLKVAPVVGDCHVEIGDRVAVEAGEDGRFQGRDDDGGLIGQGDRRALVVAALVIRPLRRVVNLGCEDEPVHRAVFGCAERVEVECRLRRTGGDRDRGDTRNECGVVVLGEDADVVVLGGIRLGQINGRCSTVELRIELDRDVPCDCAAIRDRHLHDRRGLIVRRRLERELGGVAGGRRDFDVRFGGFANFHRPRHSGCLDLVAHLRVALGRGGAHVDGRRRAHRAHAFEAERPHAVAHRHLDDCSACVVVEQLRIATRRRLDDGVILRPHVDDAARHRAHDGRVKRVGVVRAELDFAPNLRVCRRVGVVRVEVERADVNTLGDEIECALRRFLGSVRRILGGDAIIRDDDFRPVMELRERMFAR